MSRFLRTLLVGGLVSTLFATFQVNAALALPALTTCTDLSTDIQVVLRVGQHACPSSKAVANWHVEQSNTATHSGAGFAKLRICSELHSKDRPYQVIRKLCTKYQRTTDYYRAVASPKMPTITDLSSNIYNHVFLSITTESTNTDSPIAYYLIENLTDGTTAKVNRADQSNFSQISINSLHQLTRYTFTITAVNVDGTSATSPVSASITTGPIPVPLASPTFTLSSGAGSTVVGNSVNGYTISSTGGDIATYSISPAIGTTPGLSFSTSTGLISGTPTTAASALIYTITATNSTGTATGTFTVTVTSALAAPVFTLSSSSESRGTGSALTGYTISSTGGAIASYGISPAISTTPGLSFSTSTGLISGTPTTVASAQAYTITATNASGSSNATFTLTVIYGIGSTGPGGGLIYYYLAAGFNCGATFTSTGSPTGGLCHYLEAAPRLWSGGEDYTASWAVAGVNRTTLVPGITSDGAVNNTSAAIGLGYKNSLAIVAQGNDATTAAGASRAYTGGSKNDWYLPTSAEFNQLLKWACGQAWVSDATQAATCSVGTGISAIGGLQNSSYWTSSQFNASNAWVQARSSGWQGTAAKSNTKEFRPVRAF